MLKQQFGKYCAVFVLNSQTILHLVPKREDSNYVYVQVMERGG